MSLRFAPLADRNWGAALRMLKAFHQESAYRDVPLDEEMLKLSLGKTSKEGICLLAFDDDKPAGLVGGLLYGLWFSKKAMTAQELFLWVNPESRGRGVGSGLHREFEAAAKERGADYVVMMSLDDMNADKIYKRGGYSVAEKNFFRRVA